MVALQYMDALLETGFDAHPCSITATATDGGWSRHEKRLLRYATGRFVNVVMGTPLDWRRCWTQRSPTSSSMGCLANLLVCSEISPHAGYLIPGQSFGPMKQPPKPLTEVIAAYDACVVWPEQISASWRDLHRSVHVIPPTDAATLRAAIEGALSC